VVSRIARPFLLIVLRFQPSSTNHTLSLPFLSVRRLHYCTIENKFDNLSRSLILLPFHGTVSRECRLYTLKHATLISSAPPPPPFSRPHGTSWVCVNCHQMWCHMFPCWFLCWHGTLCFTRCVRVQRGKVMLIYVSLNQRPDKGVTSL